MLALVPPLCMLVLMGEGVLLLSAGGVLLMSAGGVLLSLVCGDA